MRRVGASASRACPALAKSRRDADLPPCSISTMVGYPARSGSSYTLGGHAGDRGNAWLTRELSQDDQSDTAPVIQVVNRVSARFARSDQASFWRAGSRRWMYSKPTRQYRATITQSDRRTTGLRLSDGRSPAPRFQTVARLRAARTCRRNAGAPLRGGRDGVDTSSRSSWCIRAATPIRSSPDGRQYL